MEIKLLKRLSKRERTILYVVIAIVIIAIIYNLIIEPFILYSNGLDNDIKSVKLKLRKSLSLIKDKKNIDKEYASYAKKLKAKGSNEQEITLVLDELEKIARKGNVKIVSMRPKPAQDKIYYKRFTVEIETESSMNALMKFIFDIKNSTQLLKIDKLNLNTKSSQGGIVIRSSMSISKVVMN